MKRRQFLTSLAAAAAAPAVAQATSLVVVEPPFVLKNDDWEVSITAQSLKISVSCRGVGRTVSRGVPGHRTGRFASTDTTAAWVWDTGEHIEVTLDGRDLNITVTTDKPGTLDLVDQPASAFGRALILPMGEGSYIPAGDAVWEAFLTGRHNDMSTTDDLSLPLWGVDHGDVSLHWLLTNPFNNNINVSQELGSLALKLSHEFTTLSPSTPMTMTLHLGDDLMSGAQRYRKHLIDSGAYETLEQKIARTPDAQKLIGASHVYLWGNSLLGEADVRDWPGLVAALRGAKLLATSLRAHMEPDAQTFLKDFPAKPRAWQKTSLIANLNTALDALAHARWQTDAADSATIVATYPDLRRQVVATFGKTLNDDPAKWGRGLSQKTVATLKTAGLDRLWIGLGDGWEGGLWHPEAVSSAVKAGYLIGPYDSYETAIPPGQRPDWSTAQLGRLAYDTCGVIKKDGTTRAGFQKTGYYTNTTCVMPILKDRIAAIKTAAGFNSLFLDVYATGMVFDDYRPGHEMTMQQNAKADVAAMRWISTDMQMALGSEDGKAITTGGVLFAHGMETPVIGWGDPDLQKTKTSPYYLGDYWPSGQPAIFFKPVPMKEPYRTLYFDPQFRLPMYQTVFHGSVITSHHWSYDSVKLTNVTKIRELTELLYNVPAMYHLSVETMPARIPIMQKHDAFFRPLHEALALQPMTGFAWSEDRLVQTTTFADGSRLIANFSEAPRTLDGQSLPAMSLTALLTGRPPVVYAV